MSARRAWRAGRAGFRRFLRYWSLRLILLPIAVLPPRAARRASGLYGWIAWRVLAGLRRRTRARLRLAFPDKRAEWVERTGRGVFLWVGRAGADFLHLDRLDQLDLGRIEIEGQGYWESVRGAGRGVIVVTGHLGNWELLGGWLAASGATVRVLYHPFREKRLERFVRSRRTRVGVHGISAEGTSLRALRALRRGEILGILIDRVPRGEAVTCRFFGRECQATPGPVRLARAARVPILPASLVYRRGGVRIRFEAPIAPEEFVDPAPAGATVEEITRRLTRTLEDWIRESPEQWPWFDDRWRIRRGAGATTISSARPGRLGFAPDRPAPDPGPLRKEDGASGGTR